MFQWYWDLNSRRALRISEKWRGSRTRVAGVFDGTLSEEPIKHFSLLRGKTGGICSSKKWIFGCGKNLFLVVNLDFVFTTAVWW